MHFLVFLLTPPKRSLSSLLMLLLSFMRVKISLLFPSSASFLYATALLSNAASLLPLLLQPDPSLCPHACLGLLPVWLDLDLHLLLLLLLWLLHRHRDLFQDLELPLTPEVLHFVSLLHMPLLFFLHVLRPLLLLSFFLKP